MLPGPIAKLLRLDDAPFLPERTAKCAVVKLVQYALLHPLRVLLALDNGRLPAIHGRKPLFAIFNCFLCNVKGLFRSGREPFGEPSPPTCSGTELDLRKIPRERKRNFHTR